MNYSSRITLYKTEGRQYNHKIGKTELKMNEGITLPAHVSGVSLEKTEAVFGSYKSEVAKARLQRPYKDTADRAVINNQKYNVLRHVPHKSESVFFLERVSAWT